MLGCVHDADDALQEALLRAWRGLARFEGRAWPTPSQADRRRDHRSWRRNRSRATVRGGQGGLDAHQL